MKQTHSQCTEMKTEIIYILNTQDVKGRAHCEGDRVPVVEKHTNRLRTGLAAPTPEDLPSWLERHPTYEVLVPTAKKSPPIVTSPTCKLPPFVQKISKAIVLKAEMHLSLRAQSVGVRKWKSQKFVQKFILGCCLSFIMDELVKFLS